MNLRSADLFRDIHDTSSVDEDIIPIATFSSSSPAARASSYTCDRLQRLLKFEKEKYSILNNTSTKPLASWWRSFGYPAVLNEKKESERIFFANFCDLLMIFLFSVNYVSFFLYYLIK